MAKKKDTATEEIKEEKISAEQESEKKREDEILLQNALKELEETNAPLKYSSRV